MRTTYNHEGDLHSFNDKPAIEFDNGRKKWYKDGVLHRLEGPAIINIFYSSIVYHYYQNGLRHRFLKPAYIKWVNGIKSYEKYYLKGNLHNPIGPAIICYAPYYSFKREFYIYDNELSFDEK